MNIAKIEFLISVIEVIAFLILWALDREKRENFLLVIDALIVPAFLFLIWFTMGWNYPSHLIARLITFFIVVGFFVHTKLFANKKDDVVTEQDLREIKDSLNNEFKDIEKSISILSDVTVLAGKKYVSDEIYEKMLSTKDALTRVYEKDKEDDKVDSKLAKVYGYCLPVLDDALLAYKSILEHGDDKMLKLCESNLLKVLTILDEAFRRGSEKLFDDDIMNIESNAKVLEQIAKQNSLTK